MKITPDNWTYSVYTLDDLTAQITLGASPNSDQDVQLSYHVTVLKGAPDAQAYEIKEVFQASFTQLEQALETINNKYGDWDFIDRLNSDGLSDSSGCGSCAAH